MEKTFSEAVAYRRSVRVFKDEKLNDETVASCIKNATLAPTSSNLQLWEFYEVRNSKTLEEMTAACLGQNAAKTAERLLVVVARKDLWKKRVQANINFLEEAYGNKKESEYTSREKFALNYYRKLIPTVYVDFLGILGLLKYLVFNVIGLFKPVYRQVRKSDMRIVAHKSAALAAQNFMTGMAAVGYDTCPMEGFDSIKVKQILNLPSGAEINMVIGCGVRDDNGIYGPRFRVPFSEVHFIV
ncbi:nitroreductase family protein [Croceivirga sp. JEA036]|uniref:nitroreductase family protein n=1 Tax=Croceivirga sp. JEA036 TaxID=2721162 RepID=UPI001438FE53|nr:nitroreductase family protein [Croceivirga sp. JEA036]NJB35769.1 nitroreductase family protein [Croceivirga sp. JEA036]